MWAISYGSSTIAFLPLPSCRFLLRRHPCQCSFLEKPTDHDNTIFLYFCPCVFSAQSRALGSLDAGGTCEKQQYVHYTHSCTLKDYRPHVDYCCCAFQRKVQTIRVVSSWALVALELNNSLEDFKILN